MAVVWANAEKAAKLKRRTFMLSRYLIVIFVLSARLISAADFLAQPYVQLGANPAPSAQERLSIVWHANLTKHDWQLEHRTGAGVWKRAARVLANEIRVRDTAPFQVLEAQLEGLKPGARFEYRVLRDGQALFTASAMARKKRNATTTFAVWGDCAQGTPGQKQVAEQAAKLNPDYVLIAGDIVYSRGRISEYREKYFPYYQDFAKSTLFVGVPGNHDSSNAPELEKTPDAFAFYYFWKQPLGGPADAPGPAMKSTVAGDVEAIRRVSGEAWARAGYFAFDYGAVHWTVLDSSPYADWTKPELREWLEADLKANAKAKWRIVSFHHPGFNASKAHFSDQRMRSISDILERNHVDLVMSGHVHNYQRSVPLKFQMTSPPEGKKTEVGGEFTFDREYDGVRKTRPRYPIYVVTGAGGAKLYDPEQTQEKQFQPFTAKFIADTNSFTMVEASTSKLTVWQVGTTGAELDRFVLTR